MCALLITIDIASLMQLSLHTFVSMELAETLTSLPWQHFVESSQTTQTF